MPNPINTLKPFNLDQTVPFTFSGINVSNVANINIPGGSNGYVLSTDGSGTLSWKAQTGGSGGSGDPFVAVVDAFTGDGTTSSFTLSAVPSGLEYVLITIGGVSQPRSSFLVSSSTLTFNSPPPNQALIEVTILGGSAAAIGVATTVTSSYQPNITTLGTLLSLTVSGNVTANNFVGGLVGTASTAQTVTTNAQPNITSLGTLSNLTVSGNISTSGSFVGNGSGITNAYSALNVAGSSQPNITSVGTLTSLTIGGPFSSSSFSEPVTLLTGATGTVNHDFASSSTFVHTSLATNFIANFINVPTTNNRIVVVSLLLYQGATAYLPTVLQINGFNQTIKWSNGVAPQGTPSKVDAVAFSLIRYDNNWDAYGQISTFGAV